MKRFSLPELESQTRQLDQQIRTLERRRDHMTPHDAEVATELKKQRLATKDLLVDLTRRK